MSVTSVGLSTTGTGGFLLINGVDSATITTFGTFGLTLGSALPIANGGTGQTSATGSGPVVLRTSPTFLTDPTTPKIIGSGTSGNLLLQSSGTISLSATTSITLGANTFPASTGSSGNILVTNGAGSVTWQTPSVSTVTGTLAVANGGTGQTTSTGTGAVVLQTTPTFLTSLNVPLVVGTGTSGDLEVASARNLILTSSAGGSGGIYANNDLYIKTKIIAEASLGDLIIENANSFISINPAYAMRTGGMDFHAETANNQTFSGTVIADQTLRSANNLWIGTTTSSKSVNLVAPAGIFANGRRLDANVLNYGGYYGNNGGNFSAATDTTYKGPTSFGNSALFSTALSYNTSNGDWTNISASTILVTASYSFNLTTAVGSGTAYYFIRLNGIVDTAQNLVGSRDNASGTASFLVAPGNFFGFYVRHTGFPCDFESGSNISITWSYES